MLKAIIFDVDGTMMDSRNANVAFFQAIMERAGYPRPSREEILACFHLPLWQALEKLTGSQDQEEIKRIWEFGHDPAMRSPHLLEFPELFEETLEDLHGKYLLAIVTSRIKAGVNDLFTARDIRHLFAAVVTFEDYANPKPHPEPLLVALERLGITPEEAVYVGDSGVDIEASLAAGMRSIHISPSPHAEATATVLSFSELIRAVDGITGAEA